MATEKQTIVLARNKAVANTLINPMASSSTNTTRESRDAKDKSEKVFRFVDLPPELRNAIYRQLLKTSSDVRVTRHKNQANKQKFRKEFIIARRGRRIGSELRATTIGDSKGRARKRPISDVHLSSILLISKTIHAEAAPIFYGANKFTFESGCALSEFKARTGSHFNLLRNIKIKTLSPGGRKKLRETLPCLKLGTEVTIGGVPEIRWGPRLNVEWETKWLWEMLVPFVTDRKEWRQDKSGRGGMYMLEAVADEVEQKQRLDALSFVVRPGTEIRWEDGTLVKAVKEHDFHGVIKAAIWKKWECHVAAEKSKAEDRARKLREARNAIESMRLSRA